MALNKHTYIKYNIQDIIVAYHIITSQDLKFPADQ